MKNTNKEYQKKIKEVERLFEEIKKLFPKSDMSLDIHDIDMNKLSDEWEVKSGMVKETKRVYLTAVRKKTIDEFGMSMFDITFFD